MQMNDSEMRVAFRDKLRELLLDVALMDDIDRVYVPLANLISEGLNMASKTQVIGINGAQGSGKTTFSTLMKLVLEMGFNLRVVSLSIDDIYLTRAAREELAASVHPLLLTRGVPGTHDVPLGIATLNSLCGATPTTVTYIPRFDKAVDDRVPETLWERFEGRPDVILFDGWMMGAVEQPEADLVEPINALEAKEDADGSWRRFVNEQLKTVYKPLFEHLDLLVMLQVSSFDKVYEWRSLQEQKLMMKSQGRKNSRIMNSDELLRFISHYERITRHVLAEMPSRADMLFRVNDDHRIVM
ncbi:MAG: hypothetical protein MJZ28_06320 [Paludibacteraceae bacterium]|nr:hypothetical protein [Paludibacteraceae bacterium]